MNIINPASPIQVLKILNKAGIDVKSTSEAALMSFRTNPIVKALLEFRKATKIHTTYTKPLYKAAIKMEDHRIHAHFSQNTITGRLSSSDPVNLQNQPSETRKYFIADTGKSFINADWSKIGRAHV